MQIRRIHELYKKTLYYWRQRRNNFAWQKVKDARVTYRATAKDIFDQMSEKDVGIAFVNIEEDHLNEVWCFHIFARERLLFDGLMRNAGDSLCKTQDKFRRFNEAGDHIPDCPICLELAEKFLKSQNP